MHGTAFWRRRSACATRWSPGHRRPLMALNHRPSRRCRQRHRPRRLRQRRRSRRRCRRRFASLGPHCFCGSLVGPEGFPLGRCPQVFALSGQDTACRLHRGARCGEGYPPAPRVTGRTAADCPGPGATRHSPVRRRQWRVRNSGIRRSGWHLGGPFITVPYRFPYQAEGSTTSS
jgi:hypothetical protein